MSRQNPLEGMDTPLKRTLREHCDKNLPQPMRESDEAMKTSAEATSMRAMDERPISARATHAARIKQEKTDRQMAFGNSYREDFPRG